MIDQHNSILICPVCADPLNSLEKSYACTNNHTFDKAKQGYVNLLLSNQKKTASPGDNKEMVQSRLAFLEQNYYQPISDEINSVVEQMAGKLALAKLNIADLGCGVGYYLSKLNNYLNTQEISAQYWGIDISKEAIHCANQHEKNITWIVGSAKNLPFADHSVDIILSVFSPLYYEELQRVLSPTGYVLVVTPAQHHLLELREMLFDQVKDIDEAKLLQKADSFLQLIDSIAIKTTIDLPTSADIENLLKMTPFYWRSSALKKEELIAMKKLSVTIDVTLWIFTR
jgi:23S rRNA (guanine745-N1)-methyltransferase